MSDVSAPDRQTSNGGDARTDGRDASTRIYAGLLRLYPAAFRDRYRDQMVVLFADQLRDARSRRGASGVAATWFRALLDLGTSAAGEHLRRDRPVAQSLATFEPTRPMRLLGVLGISGALLLLVPFLTYKPFEDFHTNLLRLAGFGFAGAAIALAYYPRLAVAKPRLALAVTAALGMLGALYIGVSLGSLDASGGFVGPIGVHFLSAIGPLFGAGAVYGAILLWVGAARHGMARWTGRAARIGAFALVASVAVLLGDDRFHLVESEVYGPAIAAIALAGVFLHGVGWLLLGLVLVVGDLGDRDPQRA